MFMSAVFAGAILGPLVVGALASQVSFQAAWASCAVLSLVPLRAVALARRRIRAGTPRGRSVGETRRALIRRRWISIQLGWCLFLAGSVVFLIHAIRQRDPLEVASSALFVVGLVVVLIAESRPERERPRIRRRGAGEPVPQNGHSGPLVARDPGATDRRLGEAPSLITTVRKPVASEAGALGLKPERNH
jgi:MFS family permease